MQIELLSAEADGSSQNSPQDIAAALVARHRSIRQSERQASNMISNDSEGDVVAELRVGGFGDGVGGVGWGE
jgi:hypothetical protein